MIYRMKNELERTPIEGCMGGNGTVWMEKLLTGQEEMMGKGRAYVTRCAIVWEKAFPIYVMC